MSEDEKYKTLLERIVDYLLPDLTPYEVSMYLYLLTKSLVKTGSEEIRIGKRTIAGEFGQGAKQDQISYQHVSTTLKGLEAKGCIRIGDINREGTLYRIILPSNIPLVAEKMHTVSEPSDENYFEDPRKRQEIFERDKWICQYCGDAVTSENASLDHYIPQCKGGVHTRDNLKTCCFICNSIKSGKTFEEAAPFLLKNIQERKIKLRTYEVAK